MIYKNFHEFQQKVAKLPHRLLGLDVGNKTIGIAVSDSSCKIASPLKTLQRKGKHSEIKDIQGILKEYAASSLIVGYPLHMNGDEGERCVYVRSFVEQLTKDLSIPVLLWDERMSTVSAERFLLEGDMSRAKRKEHIDAVAASVILQSFLDFLQHQL